VKCHEKYDVNSPEGKIYVRYSDRREEIHANFWADVKLEENYISPQDYYRQKFSPKTDNSIVHVHLNLLC
jgi:hypothetical protein